jgi:hypothetical protein
MPFVVPTCRYRVSRADPNGFSHMRRAIMAFRTKSASGTDSERLGLEPRVLLSLLALGSLLLGSPAAAIECGETLTAQTVATAPGFDEQFFDANAGERVVITTQASTGSPIEPLVKLFRTTGHVQVMLNGSSNFCGGVCFSPPSPGLPADDNYTIEVYDSGQNETGDYDISIESISGAFDGATNAPPTPVCGTPTDGAQVIGCGQTVTGTIDFPADSDSFVFNANANERLYLTVVPAMGSVIEPLVRLFSEGGAEVPLNGAPTWCTNTCLSVLLPSTGVYTAVVWDGGLDESGDYNLTLETVSGAFGGNSNGPPTPFCADTVESFCGESLSGTIDVLGDSDAFTFDAVAGEVIVFTSKPDASAVDPAIRLFSDSTVAEELEVALNGVKFFCADIVCVSSPLPKSGTYTAVLWDGFHNATGGYRLTMETASGTFNGASNGPPTPACTDTEVLTCGSTVVGSIDFIGDSDAHTFDANAGEIVVFSSGSIGASSVDPAILLFDNLGDEIALNGVATFCNLTGNVCISAVLPSTGTYTAVVWDGFHNAVGAYSFTMEAVAGTLGGVSNGPPSPVCGGVDGTVALSCGSTHDGEINVVADTDSISFNAEAGETIAVRTEAGLASAIEPLIRLFGPMGEVALNGAPLGSFCSGQCSGEAPVGGTYTVVLWDADRNEAGTYSAIFNGCTMHVDPRDAYLHVSAADPAFDVIPVSLASRQISPGDVVAVKRVGDFVDTNGGPDTSTEMCGIFSASDALDVKSALDRVTDALDPIDGSECVTAPTNSGSEPTDVPEDFLISAQGAGQPMIEHVTVPTGATHIFIAVPDEAYGDNSDPDADLGVVVIPEPGATVLLAAGAIVAFALAAHRRRGSRRPSG